MPYFSDPAIPNNLDCGENEVCHAFIPGDKFYAQFRQTSCGLNLICDPEFDDIVIGSDLVSNGSFTGNDLGWTKTGNWAYGTNNEVCTPGAISELAQTGLGMSLATVYRVTFDLTRTAGSVRMGLGEGAGANYTDYLDVTGSYSFDVFYNDVADDTIIFQTDDEFNGALDNVTVKEVSYDCWEPTNTWDLATGSACKTSASLSFALEESVADYITPLAYYVLTFSVRGYGGGSLTAQVSNQSDTLSTVITGNGDYVLYYLPLVTGVVKFTPSTDFIGCISDPDLRLLRNDHYAQIYDPVTDTIHATAYPTYYKDFVTWAYDFDLEGEVDFGCYLFGVFDLCQLEEEFLTNGNLVGGSGDSTDMPNIVDPPGWGVQGSAPVNSYWSWSDNVNAFTAEILVGNNSVTLGNWPSRLVMPGGTYEVSLEIVSIDPGMFVRFSLFAYAGIQSGSFTTAGTHTYQFNYDPDLDSYGLAQFLFGGQTAGDTGAVVLDNLSIRKIEPITSSYTSDCIQYKESAPKSKLFQAYNDQTSFGFDFLNTGYRLSQRLVCRSFGPTYEKDKRVFNYGSGESGTYYAAVTKWFNVYLDLYPETVHDGMALQLDCNHFLIGDTESNLVEYTARPDDYVPEWNASGAHSLATARFEVKPKEDGEVFNKGC